VLAGQYKENRGETIVMKAVVDPDLYICYFNFGAAESLNYINILYRSSIVGALLLGEFNSKVPAYEINCRLRDWLYFLVGIIYPCWSIFANSPIPYASGRDCICNEAGTREKRRGAHLWRSGRAFWCIGKKVVRQVYRGDPEHS